MSDSLRHHGLQHARLPCPSSIISRRLLKLMSLESVMPSNRLILCHPLLLLPPSFPASGSFPMSWLFISAGQGIGASTSAFNHSNEYSGLTSFRIDRFDLLAVQGTLKKSFPATQFKSINFSALSLLYGPTLTSIHDY